MRSDDFRAHLIAELADLEKQLGELGRLQRRRDAIRTMLDTDSVPVSARRPTREVTAPELVFDATGDSEVTPAAHGMGPSLPRLVEEEVAKGKGRPLVPREIRAGLKRSGVPDERVGLRLYPVLVRLVDRGRLAKSGRGYVLGPRTTIGRETEFTSTSPEKAATTRFRRLSEEEIVAYGLTVANVRRLHDRVRDSAADVLVRTLAEQGKVSDQGLWVPLKLQNNMQLSGIMSALTAHAKLSGITGGAIIVKSKKHTGGNRYELLEEFAALLDEAEWVKPAKRRP